MEYIARCRQAIFENLWHHYYQRVPIAPVIEKAITERNEAWIEDHVAFRTLPGENNGKHVLQRVFELLGYERQEDYHFAEKQLDAFWMKPLHDETDSASIAPKIFISELLPESFSTEFQNKLAAIANEVSESPIPTLEALTKKIENGDTQAEHEFIERASLLLTQGPAWSQPDRESYRLLQEESEYAAWTYLFGHQINHFTLSVHLMTSFSDIQELGEYIENELNIPMNHSGGLVKGTPEILLEQIATMATKVDYEFTDGVESVSYGFVEFAKRYALPQASNDGAWDSYYQGFVAANADKIFESTNR